ncbi:MAG: GNAT family N-acetyltransferase [Actinomycetes bacterium]
MSTEPHAQLRTKEQPVLSDGVVTLRRPTERDVPDIVEAIRDPETIRWTTVPTPYDAVDARAFLEVIVATWAAEAGAIWGMYPVGLGERGRPGGSRWSGGITIGAKADDPARGEVGFNCAPWARDSGLTTAALRLVCAWGFQALGLARIEWRAYVGNDASRRVAAKVGFVFEGTQRSRLVQRGERRDSWVASLLPGDLSAAGSGPRASR